MFKNYNFVVQSYIEWKKMWYIKNYKKNWDSVTFYTFDWTEIPQKDLTKKLTQLKNNPNLKNKYRLIKQLRENWLSPSIQDNDKTYKIDFEWINDKSTLTFSWNQVIFNSNQINKSYNLKIRSEKELNDAVITILSANKIKELENERLHTQRMAKVVPNWYKIKGDKIDYWYTANLNLKSIDSDIAKLQPQLNGETILTENKRTKLNTENSDKTTHTKPNLDNSNTFTNLGIQEIKAEREFEYEDNDTGIESYEVTLKRNWNQYRLEVNDWWSDSYIDFNQMPTKKEIQIAINNYNKWDSQAINNNWKNI